MNLQMLKMDLEKAEEPGIKLPTSTGSEEKAREFQKNSYFCFIDYAKAFDCVDHNKYLNIPIPKQWLRNQEVGRDSKDRLDMVEKIFEYHIRDSQNCL